MIADPYWTFGHVQKHLPFPQWLWNGKRAGTESREEERLANGAVFWARMLALAALGDYEMAAVYAGVMTR